MTNIEPDEHLRAALHHAPDAELAAPQHISAQILAAAHRSAGQRPAPTAPARRWFSRWPMQNWGASGALAALVMAGLIPVLWRGEVPGPSPEARVMAGSEPALAPAPAPAPMAPAPAVTAPVPQRTLRAPAPPPPPALRPPPRPDTATAAAKPFPAAAPAMPEPLREPSGQALDKPASPATQPPQDASPARDELRAEQGPRRFAPTPATAQKGAAESTAPVMQSAARPDAAAGLGAATESARASSRLADNSIALRRQAPWQATASQGAVASWAALDSHRAPDAPWLQRLEALAHSGWPATPETTPAPGAKLLQWHLAGVRVARLWLEDGAALWCAGAPPCQRAPMPAPALRALLAELAR